MRRLLALFLLHDGRKVGLGLWILLLSCVFLATDKISSSDWITCLFLSTALVGGGTVADKFIRGRDAPSSSAK